MYKKLSLLFIGLLFVATGCEEQIAYVTLNQDGSGTIRVRYFENPELNGPDMPKAYDPVKEARETVKDIAQGMGAVTFVSGKPATNKRGWKGYEGLFSFKDINQVKATFASQPVDDDDTGTTSVSFAGIPMPLSPTYSFSYTPGVKLEITAKPEKAGGDESEEEKPAPDPAKEMFMKAMLDGFRETILLKVDGPIRDSNAKFIIGKNKDIILLFDVDMEKIVDDSIFKKIKAMKQGKGPKESISVPGVRIQNPGEKVTVSFHAGAGSPEPAPVQKEKDDAGLRTKNGTSPAPPSPATSSALRQEPVKEMQITVGQVDGADVPMTFVWCPPGSFVMGSPDAAAGASPVPQSQRLREDGETLHKVTLTKGFWIAKTECTQLQWKAVTGKNPSKWKGDNLPVELLSWKAAVAFCRELSEQEGRTYRLPTEAEWEYACRAGTTTAWSFGDDPAQTGDYAWFNENSEEMTHPVGEKLPNAWGLHDMHGNVWEWCQDRAGDYPEGPVTDPTGPEQAESSPAQVDPVGKRILRGGSYGNYPNGCRSASRHGLKVGGRHHSWGFRPVRSAGD